MVETTFIDIAGKESVLHSLNDPRPIRKFGKRERRASEFTTIGVINQIDIQLCRQKIFDISLLSPGGITDLDNSSIVQLAARFQPSDGLIVLR